MMLTPEIMLVDESLLDAAGPALADATRLVADLIADSPVLAEQMEANGWTPRMIAWGHVLFAGLIARGAAYYDEEAS